MLAVWTATPGAIAHIAGPNPSGGWRVVDVLESQAGSEASYGSERPKPAMAQVGEPMTTRP